MIKPKDLKNGCSGIYEICTTVNNKKYIGSAKKVSIRFNRHLHDLKHNVHGNKKLQNHVNKYGIDTMYFNVIEYCNIENLITREQYHIDNSVNLFNIRLIAESNLGVKIPISKRTYGNAMSQKNKDALSKKNIGNKYRLGKKHSEETKAKLSKAIKGRVVSEETRLKLSILNKGSTHTIETRKILSEKLKGNTNFKNVDRQSEKLRNAISDGKTKFNVEQYDLFGNLIFTHKNGHCAARAIGGSLGCIYMCYTGKRKTHKGFIWKKVKIKK